MNPSVLSAEGLSGVLFLVFIAVTLAGALVATNARGLIRSVAGLAMCFVGVAGLYYYLGSPFVALMQVLIYVGAVCVTIIFAVMLAETSEVKRLIKNNTVAVILVCLSSLALIAALCALGLRTDWKRIAAQAGSGSLEALGQSLLTTYNFSFELISVVLLLAIVGSLALARMGRSKS